MTNVTIYKSFNEADAMLVRSRLEAAGFHVFMPDEAMAASYSLAIGGIRLQVPDTESEDAKAFLAAPPEAE